MPAHRCRTLVHLVPVTLGACSRLFAEGTLPNVRLRPIVADVARQHLERLRPP